MPTRFLSRAELARLGAFPEAIDRDDLAEHFRLSGDDLEFPAPSVGRRASSGSRCSCVRCAGWGSSPRSRRRACRACGVARGDAGRAGAGGVRLCGQVADAAGASACCSRARGLASVRRSGGCGPGVAGGACARARPSGVSVHARVRGAARAADRAAGDRPADQAGRVGAGAGARANIRAARRAVDRAGMRVARRAAGTGRVEQERAYAAVLAALPPDHGQYRRAARRAAEARVSDRACRGGPARSLRTAAEPASVARPAGAPVDQPGARAAGGAAALSSARVLLLRDARAGDRRRGRGVRSGARHRRPSRATQARRAAPPPQPRHAEHPQAVHRRHPPAVGSARVEHRRARVDRPADRPRAPQPGPAACRADRPPDRRHAP
jgi:hypothetical protein